MCRSRPSFLNLRRLTHQKASAVFPILCNMCQNIESMWQVAGNHPHSIQELQTAVDESRFDCDQAVLNIHIEGCSWLATELRQQLGGQRSVTGFVHCDNHRI